jgi:hypothetical protein
MSNEYELNPADRELERALGGLKPVSQRLERDRLMFRAGRASVERKQVAWPALSGVLVLMLAVSWAVRLQPSKGMIPAGAIKSVAMAPGYSIGQGTQASHRTVRENEPVSGAFWQWRKLAAKRPSDSLIMEQSGFQSGGVEIWRPFKPVLSDDLEMKL